MKLLLFFGLLAAATADETSLLKSANDAFTAKLFNEVINSNPDKSVILSAFSVLTPLAQLTLASEGESHDELLRAIGLPDDNTTKAVFQGLNAKQRAVKGVDLQMASRVYVAKDAELNPSFAELSHNVFNSDVENVDFADNQNTAKAVNAWVEDQTNHKIKDLVDPNSLGVDTRALLVNAIYFKGSWKEKFNKEKTQDDDFHVTKDLTVKVPMMHKTADFRYVESNELDAKLLELPYEGEESSFLIVLPNKLDGLPALQEKLKDPETLNKAVGQMYETEVVVTIPKLKIETKTDLGDVLKKIDIKKIFNSGEARLNKMLSKESGLFVSQAIQKAYIEINEEGAEAAAANANHYSKSGMVSIDTDSFNADHPFFFKLQFGDINIFSGFYTT